MGWGQPKIHKPFFAENIVLRRGSPLLCRCFGQEIAWSLWEWEWYALHSRPLVSVQYTFLYFSFCKEYILKACCARCWELVGWGWVLQGRRLSALLPKYLPAVVILHIYMQNTSICCFAKECLQLTGMNVRASLTLSGTAWTSLMLAVGRITVVNPALCAPNTLQRYFNYSMEESFSAKMLIYIQTITLSRTPPTGSTRPCNDISPVIAWMIDKGNGLRFWVI